MTSIERTEAAIRAGSYEVTPLRFRVYKLTLSQPHLLAGTDFMLYMSYDHKEDAEREVEELMKDNFILL